MRVSEKIYTPIAVSSDDTKSTFFNRCSPAHPSLHNWSKVLRHSIVLECAPLKGAVRNAYKADVVFDVAAAVDLAAVWMVVATGKPTSFSK